MALCTGLLILPAYEPARLADLAALAEDTGYDDFWLADERFFREVYACLALCAVRTHRIRLGPCVTDPYSRHPALTATAMATLDGISNQRAVLGLGAGVSGFRELGVDTSRSAVAIREAVELIRRLLAGETVTVQGRVISFTDGRLDFAPPRADLPIYVASQRAGGCRVAGRVADGAIMQGAVADPLVRFFSKTVHHAARQAGRDPARVALVARLNVCVADDRAAARNVMRPTIVRSLSAQRPDFFTFATAGLTLPAGLRDKVLALPYTHDPAPLRAIAPEVVRLARSGVAEIMIYPLAVDGRIETTIERFQSEVMSRVRAELR